MTRKEYELIYSALRSYRTYMMPEDEILSEKILDDLFYPSFDILKGVEDLEETAPEDNEIKSLNFR